MTVTREELWSRLRRGEIAPVYVLYGAETYLRDLAVQKIVDFSFAEDDFRDFNETIFSLNTEGNLQQALAAAEQLPMMASRRVIRITDVKVSASGIRDTIREEHEAMLTAYLTKPAPHSVMLFVADELNGVRKLSKLLTASSIAVDFKPLDDAGLGKWGKDRAKECGAEIDDRTLRLLVAHVGSDVRRLTNEINKLATAALPETSITADLVEALVPNSREANNFDLTDHLVAGRKSQALATLRKILDDGGEPVALLGLLSYNYRRLLMANEMMRNGVGRPEVASVVKLRYRDQEPFLAAARRAKPEKLVLAIENLANTDIAIKTSVGGGGSAGSRMLIEMLACELALM